MSLREEFGRLLEDAASEVGQDLSASIEEVRAYYAQRVYHLASIVGEPGYGEALLAERDAVALKAGINAVAVGDAADMRLLGIIEGALGIAARAVV